MFCELCVHVFSCLLYFVFAVFVCFVAVCISNHIDSPLFSNFSRKASFKGYELKLISPISSEKRNNTWSSLKYSILSRNSYESWKYVYTLLPIKHHFWYDCPFSMSILLSLHCLSVFLLRVFDFSADLFFFIHTLCRCMTHSKNFKKQFNSKSFYGDFAKPNR